MDILSSVRIFYADDEDPCIPMAQPLGTHLVEILTCLSEAPVMVTKSPLQRHSEQRSIMEL